ncbi:MAG: hypothetical protein ACFFCE_00150 [Promethearchaeota archaeon]
MASVFSWFKKELSYIINSFFEIIKAIILVILITAGLGCAIFLIYLGFNGIVSTIAGLITEIISLVLCYLIFRGYLKIEEKTEDSNTKGKTPKDAQ